MEQIPEKYKMPGECIMAFDVLYQAVSLAQEHGVYKLRDAHRIVEALDTINRYIPIEGKTTEEQVNGTTE